MRAKYMLDKMADIQSKNIYPKKRQFLNLYEKHKERK